MTLRKRRVECPMVLQMEAAECGAAALAMVMSYYGAVVPLERLRDECGVSRDGSKASSLLKVARNYRFRAQGYREEELDGLERHALPLILFWNFNHFVVYTGRRGRKFCINDPALGPRLVDAKEMDESFSGVLLEIVPGEGFGRFGREPSLAGSLWRRLEGCRGTFLLLLLTGLLLVPGNLLTPNLSKIFIDNFMMDRFYNWGTPLITLALLTLLVTLFLTWIQCNGLVRLNLKVALTGSASFLFRVLHLPVSFFAGRQSGELATRVQLNDRVAAFLSEQLAANLLSLITLFFYAVVMFCYDAVLGTLAAVMGAAVLLLLQRKLKSRKLLGQSIQLDTGMLYGTSATGVMLIETLKASGGENDFFSGWSGFQARSLLGRQKLEASTVLLGTFPNSVQKVTVALVTGLGALRILAGSMTGGAYLVFQLILGYFFVPLEQLVNLGNSLQEIDAGLKRLDDVMTCREDPYSFDHAGRPILYIPCQDGRFFDFEDFHMADTLAPWIDSGKVMVLSIDTLDRETWSDPNGNPYWRIRRYEQWLRYIVDEAVPKLQQIARERNGWDGNPGVIAFGCSLGATHAVNLYLRRPDVFCGCLALSGIYTAAYGFGNYMDELVYMNSPVDYMANFPENHPYMELFRNQKAVICCGQGAWEQPDTTWYLKRIFEAKHIPVWVDLWGQDVKHDWDWWYKQAAYYMPYVLGE